MMVCPVLAAVVIQFNTQAKHEQIRTFISHASALQRSCADVISNRQIMRDKPGGGQINHFVQHALAVLGLKI